MGHSKKLSSLRAEYLLFKQGSNIIAHKEIAPKEHQLISLALTLRTQRIVVQIPSGGCALSG